jgi:hypothetical protein
MTAIMENVKELCEEHSLHYHINNNRVLIDDEFWFYINNQDDINSFKTYIHIIKGRNEMVNKICNKLNTTIEKGCNIKLFEFHQNEMVCISDNSIFININNMTDTCYTKYEQFIEFKLKIVFKQPLEYYLIDEEQYYKLKSIGDLNNVLHQKCTFEKKQCDRNKGYEEDLCANMVDMYKSFPNPYGLCYDESKYMLSTAHGYRNKYSSFSKYYFCSSDCMNHFAKYNRCDRCHEGGRGKYIDSLRYTLCEGRGDHNPSCIVKYEFEKRYISDDKNKQIYKIVVDYLKNCKDSNLSLKSNFEELFESVKKNDFIVSLDILTDICYAINTFQLRDRNENNDINVCSECGCTKHSKDNDEDKDNKDECYKCNKRLWTEFYYNYDADTEINGLVCETCCDKQNYYILLKNN